MTRTLLDAFKIPCEILVWRNGSFNSRNLGPITLAKSQVRNRSHMPALNPKRTVPAHNTKLVHTRLTQFLHATQNIHIRSYVLNYMYTISPPATELELCILLCRNPLWTYRGCQTGYRQSCSLLQPDRPTDRQADKQRQTERQTDRQF